MRNFYSNCYWLSIIIMLIMVSCDSNDGTVQSQSEGLRVSTEMLKLKNDGSSIAGTIEIMAEVPEVELEWIASLDCKLNTQVSKLYLENGRVALPVEWLKPFEDGSSLSAISFNAGVKITAGDESKYVSLIWGNKEGYSFDAKWANTRAVDPLFAAILVSPQQLRMNYQTGGATSVILNNVTGATIDYSGILPNMKIQLGENTPVWITESRPLIFTWAGTPPTTSFTANVIINGIGVPPVTLELIYEAEGGDPGPGPDPGQDITPGPIVPAGDISDEGGIYYCNFTGTYTGQFIFRATKNGVEIGRKSATGLPSLQNLTIPGIGADKTATIRFEYSINGGTTWILIDTRTQKMETLAVNAIEPPGNIPANGGTYRCAVTGTYSKVVAVHAREGATTLASTSGRVPSNLSLTIPAYTGTGTRLIIFEYSKNGGPWLLMEVKRQNGR